MSTRPAPSAPRPFAFPQIHRARLDNGLGIVTVVMPGRALCAAVLVVDAGACHDSIEGAATLLARAFNEGTQVRDAAAFADACEGLGMQLGAAAAWDTMSLTMSAPRSRLGQALGLMAEAAWTPSIPDSNFARIKAERSAAIDQELAVPAIRAAFAFPKTIYTPDSTYARSLRGTKTSVEGLTRDTLLTHHSNFVEPSDATLVVAGDVEPAWVIEQAQKAFGGYNAAPGEREAPSAEPLLGPTRITLVDRPGSVQSNIVIGHTGITRYEADREALTLVNYALCGSFSSRVNTRLREELGYTYGARGEFDGRRVLGPFAISAPVQAPSTADAVRETIEIVRGMWADGPTEEELIAAKEYLAGVFPLRFETPDQLANAVADLEVYGLPDEDLTRFHERIVKVPRADAVAAAQRHLRPDELSVVVVGDGSVVREGLEAIAPVTLAAD